MIEKFHCLGLECRETVEYERDPIRASQIYSPHAQKKKKKKTVYLTCKKGHTHRYEFTYEVYE